MYNINEIVARNSMFDETPCMLSTTDNLNWKSAEAYFGKANKEFSKTDAKKLGIIVTYAGEEKPSNGGILLFSNYKSKLFPGAIIRCTRFAGITKKQILDQIEIDEHLPAAIDAVLGFINKNTQVKTDTGKKIDVILPKYPLVALREAIINAIVHTDYTIKDSSITVAIFNNRIEITNPGGLPYGLSVEDALTGFSRSRNRVIARTFHALKLIEQWGSGVHKIIQSCLQHGLKEPKFEEVRSQFRVTLYSQTLKELHGTNKSS